MSVKGKYKYVYQNKEGMQDLFQQVQSEYAQALLQLEQLHLLCHYFDMIVHTICFFLLHAFLCLYLYSYLHHEIASNAATYMRLYCQQKQKYRADK